MQRNFTHERIADYDFNVGALIHEIFSGAPVSESSKCEIFEKGIEIK